MKLRHATVVKDMSANPTRRDTELDEGRSGPGTAVRWKHGIHEGVVLYRKNGEAICLRCS